MFGTTRTYISCYFFSACKAFHYCIRCSHGLFLNLNAHLRKNKQNKCAPFLINYDIEVRKRIRVAVITAIMLSCIINRIFLLTHTHNFLKYQQKTIKNEKSKLEKQKQTSQSTPSRVVS